MNTSTASSNENTAFKVLILNNQPRKPNIFKMPKNQKKQIPTAAVVLAMAKKQAKLKQMMPALNDYWIYWNYL